MRRWIVRIVLLAAFVALAIGARAWFLRPNPIEVTVAPVERGDVEETITNTRAGTVQAHRRTRLSPETGGMAVAIPFDQGQLVKKGDVLLRLDDAMQRARLTLGQRELDTAQARRNQACVQAERAQRELVRFRRLHQEGIVAEDLLDQTQAGADAARASCEAAASDVERARSTVRLAEVELEKMVLRAPFDGIVAEISIELGEWTSPSPPALPIPPVIDLIDPTSIYVSAPMDEVDAARLEPGLRGRVTVDSHRGREFWGSVVRVSPFVLDVEAQNRTVEIDVELDDETLAATLRPGTSADVEVVLETRANTLRIPTSALYEGDKVLAVEGGRLVERRIRIGLKNWNWTEVITGLEEGDPVVTSLDRPEIKPGAVVADVIGARDGDDADHDDDAGDDAAPPAP
ncbi:MAG TPA: efflux RND transporter periplasmic adaptor subunit [Thermoanaerobaculia bacterium]|nr:efflux RND transporter periplasmic adaptor subunit [Thermoanaerobaculia bacterium]